MVFPWEEMNVSVGLNLHMDTAVLWITTADKMAESRMVFKMGFYGQRRSKSPWSEAVLFSISLAGPPMTDDDCSTNNNPSTPHPLSSSLHPVFSENVLDEYDILSFD